jgi:hypothetical protein
MQMQSTYWLKKVLKMILYVNALLCTLQHIVIHAMQLSGVNSESGVLYYSVAHEKPARRLVDQRGPRSRTLYRKLNKCKCKVHWNTVQSTLISECFASKIKPCKSVHGIHKIFVAEKN